MVCSNEKLQIYFSVSGVSGLIGCQFGFHFYRGVVVWGSFLSYPKIRFGGGAHCEIESAPTSFPGLFF